MDKRLRKIRILTQLLEQYTGKKVILEKTKSTTMPDFLKYDNLFPNEDSLEDTETAEPIVKPAPTIAPDKEREPKRSPLLPKNPPKVLPKPKAKNQHN